MEVGLILAILVFAFIFVAFILLADSVKGPEKFIMDIRDGTPAISTLEIFDAANKSLFYYTNGDEEGEKRLVLVPDCASFIISWKGPVIVGVGPFVTKDGRVIKTTVGELTTEFEVYTNTDQIKRST